MYVEPLFATCFVGNNDEVDWPFGRGKVGGISRCFWRCVGRCEAHLRGGKGDEDFDVCMGEDVRGPPGSVIPFGEYE